MERTRGGGGVVEPLLGNSISALPNAETGDFMHSDARCADLLFGKLTAKWLTAVACLEPER